MKRLILLFLAFFANLAFCDEFVVGGRPIHVPPPAGYTRVTDAMTLVTRFTDQLADPMNDTLAFYIPETGAPVALAGKMPPMDRYFILKVNKKLLTYTMGSNEFSKLKSSIKEQNKKAFDEIKAKMPGYMDKINSGIKKEFDVNMAMEITQMVPLEPHRETDNSLSYSMYINYGVTTESGKVASVTPATATFIDASGVVLFLYSYGKKDDLEWTRSGSSAWADSIIQDNAPPPQKSPGSGGIDWSQVGISALVGGTIGAIIMLIRRLFPSGPSVIGRKK